jgi:hypothetical protein
MLEITMTNEEAQRLKALLTGLRGKMSIRKFCSSIPIKYSSWRTWEAMESVPTLENLQLIAKLKGWSLGELESYLKTGDLENNPYSIDALLGYAKNLTFEERVELARRLLETPK